MTITIELPPELEKRLHDRAVAAGLRAEEFVLGALAERLGASTPNGSALGEEESQLLNEINRGLPDAAWRRYHELVSRRREEELTEAEHGELISLTDEIELAHSQRLEKLLKLAALRQVSVDALMEELGIRDPGHA